MNTPDVLEQPEPPTAVRSSELVRHGDQKLIEAIQAAVNELKVPKSCDGKMRGEYVKCGMRLAVQAVNDAIEKYKRSAAMSNSEIRHGGPETPEVKPQRNPPLPASNG